MTLCSCLPKKQNHSPRIKIVTSVPAIYDWTRNIINEKSNNTIYLSLIIKNGLNYHNYTPSPHEEDAIKTADLFIYTGGDSEQWACKLATEKSICLSDDIHSLLSPKNAIIYCQKICEAICQLDTTNSDAYKKNCEDYITQLKLLSDAYELTAMQAKDSTFIFCDRFPFKNLFDDYGLNYITAFDICPAPLEEAKKINSDTAKILGKKIDQTNATAVYTMEILIKKLQKQQLVILKILNATRLHLIQWKA